MTASETKPYLYTATCMFGLEGLLGEEIDALGYTRETTMDGRIHFVETRQPVPERISGFDTRNGCMSRLEASRRVPLTSCLKVRKPCHGRTLSAETMFFP